MGQNKHDKCEIKLMKFWQHTGNFARHVFGGLEHNAPIIGSSPGGGAGHWANTTLCGDLEGDMKDCFTLEVGEMNEGDSVYNSLAQQGKLGLCIKKLGRFPFI